VGNDLSGSTVWHGAKIVYSSDVIVQDNDFSGNRGLGLRLTDNDGLIELYDNRFADNGRYAIQIYDSSVALEGNDYDLEDGDNGWETSNGWLGVWGSYTWDEHVITAYTLDGQTQLFTGGTDDTVRAAGLMSIDDDVVVDSLAE
jgi:parallel beta-helix repeat protein